jgi:plasmid stability protein
MATKKVLVGVDDEVWRKVKARAAEEGRSVGLVVENALKLYLGQTVATEVVTPATANQPAVGWVSVKPQTWAEESAAKLRVSLDRQREIRERQEYLRDHPEDEQQ